MAMYALLSFLFVVTLASRKSYYVGVQALFRDRVMCLVSESDGRSDQQICSTVEFVLP